MLMDFELFTKTNEVISNLASTENLDLIVMQDDKYRNTEYETIIYGLGSSKGMKKEEYYFNALNADENSRESKLANDFLNEPVSYYENIGTGFGSYIQYRVVVNTLNRQIKILEVSYVHSNYGNGNEPRYTTVEVIDLGKSKFTSKIIR